MGRYLCTNLWSSSVNKTLRSYCKIRYLMSLLRKHPRLAKAPLGPDLHRYSLLSSRHPSRLTRKATLKDVNQNDTGSTSNHFLRGFTNKLKHLHSVRFYSSSNRNTFKPEAPIGIFEEPKHRFLLSSLGGRLGESFNRLARHINIYFKRMDAENASLVVRTPKYLGRSQRRSQSQRAARERDISKGKDTTQTLKSKDKQECSEKSPSRENNSGLQLFHASFLATKFGESYSYVANHINSGFSRGSNEKVQMQENLETMPSSRGANNRLKRRHMQNTYILKSEKVEMSQVKAGADQATVEPNNISSSWEEGYFHFARHINKYFGAKVTEEVDQDQNRREHLPVEKNPTSKKRFSANATSQTQGAMSQLKQDKPIIHETGGLFHRSRKTTQFGENFFQMAGYINQYFKGQKGLDEDIDRNLLTEMDPKAAASERLKTVSFMDCLRHPTSAISDFLGAYLKLGPLSQTGKLQLATTSPETMLNRKIVLSWRQAEEMTQGLIGTLSQASSPEALTACVDALNEHLIRYPSCKALMWQVCWIGVVPLQVLKLLEAETGKKVHQLFDYICGVSTGAILAFMLGLARFSLEECADMYCRFGSEVFRQNPLVGTVSAVSAVVNWGTTPKAFVFRNYNHKPGSLSRYAGGSVCQMWQAVRASSAAPGYFQEFPLQSDIHQDGGIILNNPCALAVHESRLLWPNQPFQCVLSLGTGRYDNAKRGPATSTSLRAKISNLVNSATDTEGVHTLLDDLLPPDVYFRFNPMLSAVVSLDESRPWAMDQLQRDTQNYLERNRPKLARLCLVLGAERTAASKTKDWMSERAWEMKQRWV
ncbi:calcium-independent phospholipase A2-gamma [Etheostoma spectabile]|uniref:calcium-independent phospholipase A2-gamma n=1 Tax=Etheostoma spectabile TaxID=54343 RepID=UPI0013AEEE54|nr:calcium-independent phospholipase A2-gamma-like [Etheostoma spectabile]